MATSKPHAISQCLLRQWEELGAGRRDPQLISVDLWHGHSRHLSAGAVGRGDDYLAGAPARLEPVWSAVETDFPGALDAARKGRVFDDPRAIETLQRMLWIHFLRGLEMRRAHANAAQESIDQTSARLRAEPSTLAAAFRHQTGLDPTGPGALDAALERLIDPFRTMVEQGELLTERLAHHYHDFPRLLATYPTIQIARPPEGSQLVIGDCPAIPINYDRAETAPWDPVPAFDSHTILLPIAPDCLLGLAPTSGPIPLAPNAVEFFNQQQIARAHRYVYCTPSSGLADYIKSVRPPAIPIAARPLYLPVEG